MKGSIDEMTITTELHLEELIIDPEFESVIPPLTELEFDQLRKNILEDKEVFHPIIVWNNIIIEASKNGYNFRHTYKHRIDPMLTDHENRINELETNGTLLAIELMSRSIEQIENKIKEATIYSEIMGSDHCPIAIDLKN